LFRTCHETGGEFSPMVHWTPVSILGSAVPFWPWRALVVLT
jgi:hypothetical protein